MITNDTIAEIINQAENTIFKELVTEYGLLYGDIAPEQVVRLERIKQELAEVCGDFVHQNLPENNL